MKGDFQFEMERDDEEVTAGSFITKVPVLECIVHGRVTDWIFIGSTSEEDTEKYFCTACWKKHLMMTISTLKIVKE